nr:DUF6029 family protein [uncultured Flavobacterium sp.]
MKKIIYLSALLSFSLLTAQEQEQTQDSVKKKKITVYGGLESNSQWYLNDPEREITHPEEPFRSNNYLQVNVNYGRFTAGIQGEAYEPMALLNYNPKFEGTNVGTYYLNYKSNKLDLTAGYFYEQFGSGILLRSWEDRSLGINNALRGGRAIFRPTANMTFTALYGKHRTGFDVTDSDTYGFNSDINLAGFLHKDSFDLTFGFSYVGRDESIPFSVVDPKFNKLTSAYATRVSFSKNAFYFSGEYNIKEKDAILERSDVNYDFVKPGNALIVNFGYSKKGLGFDATLRRMENMTFLSERQPEVYAPEISSLYYNDRMMNFIPALTKQHHSNLANIYVYQAQSRVAMQMDEQVQKFGEIGGQLDFFYEFKKGSSFGGKYGTKLSLNMSNWFNLKADYHYFDSEGNYNPDYSTEFFGGNEKYFSDYNIEIAKKLSAKFKGTFGYINQYYNNKYIQGIFQNTVVKTHIVNAEGVYNFKGTRAITVGLEHMWADSDRKNWASMLVEYNHDANWSIFASDMYNYGFDENSHLISETDTFDIHFYNVGGAYRRGSTRFTVGYGRQRGGLVCSGGVCRNVPPSTGVSFSLTTSF